MGIDALARPEALINALAESQMIAIAGHIKPDGDCIGAAMALAIALERAGKKVYVLLPPYASNYDIVPGKELIVDKADIDSVDLDLFIAVDCADENRLGEFQPYFKKAKKTINIDHHISNTRYADINFVIADVSSTSEIVFHAISSDFLVDKEIASALYAGIIYDTGGLRYPSTSSDTLHVVSQLLNFGIDFTNITEQMIYSHSIEMARLLARAIDKMEITPCKKVIYTALEKKDFEDTCSNVMDTEGIVAYLLGTDGIWIAVFFYEDEGNGIKASFRSKGQKDVCKIAQKFGGGGHANASACILKMDLNSAKQVVMDEIYNVMNGTEND